ncbi:uncharacterized protein LOC116034860 isoform X2 [Sander lucioperca]|uniref:uncharacterized protein LOC116034860 isoform X2 n=1 Tax=Sander lucioperca TaxID=283035 RepID=UPI00125DE6F8|nr:uncharacterized protein LOC116034860 isoform X2 [Sander lucioperca]
MATEFTQDSLLYFLQSSGGTVKNSDLLLHFRHFIRDHADQNRNREQFKKFVNSLATVKQIDGVSYVVLRKKFKGHVTGGGEGGSSEPPRLCARKNTEPSPENAKLSPARSTEKPRQKLREVTTPAPPGVIAGKTILPAAGIMLNNNNNSNMETNLNLKQKRQQVIRTPELCGRPAADQVVSQISETAQMKTPSLSEPFAPDQCTKAQHRVGFELPPGITPVVAALRHHEETSQQLPVPETLRGREACLQPEGGLHREPPLHPISLQLQAAPRPIRLRQSYKSAVSFDEDEEEVQIRQCSAGGTLPLSTPLRDVGRAISASSPCILDPPVSPVVVSSSSSSSSERKLPKIYLQDVERETMTPRGPGWSLESGVGQRGQWAGPGLEPGSVSGKSTRQSLPLEAERYMASPDGATEVVPHHDAHADRRYSQPAGVQLEPRQGPNQSQGERLSSNHSSIFSPSSDAPRPIRLRQSYKSAVSFDENEEEVQIRRCSAGGARPLSTPLRDMGRAISASSPCILDTPVSPSVVSSSSSSSSERKLPKIYIQDVERETMTPRGPGWSLESGVGQRGQWAGPGLEPGSVSGESTRQSLSLEAERYMASPDGATEVVPHHDAHADCRYSQTAGVQLEPRQGLNQSQGEWLSSSHSSIFSPSSDAGPSSSDYLSPRGLGWNGSYEDLHARAGETGGGSKIQEVLERARRANSKTTVPWHNSTGHLHDDQEPTARLSPFHYSSDYLHDNQNSTPCMVPCHLSTGDIYDREEAESSEGSTSSPPLGLHPAVARRLSSLLRSRMSRSLGADLDQLVQEESRAGGGSEAARLNRLHLISSSLSLRYNLSSSSLSSCSTPPRCQSLVDLDEEVKGRGGRRSSPIAASSTARHEGPSRQDTI